MALWVFWLIYLRITNGLSWYLPLFFQGFTFTSLIRGIRRRLTLLLILPLLLGIGYVKGQALSPADMKQVGQVETSPESLIIGQITSILDAGLSGVLLIQLFFLWRSYGKLQDKLIEHDRFSTEDRERFKDEIIEEINNHLDSRIGRQGRHE